MEIIGPLKLYSCCKQAELLKPNIMVYVSFERRQRIFKWAAVKIKNYLQDNLKRCSHIYEKQKYVPAQSSKCVSENVRPLSILENT